MIVTTECGVRVLLNESPLIVGEPYVFNIPGEDVWYLGESWKPFYGEGGVPVLESVNPEVNRKSFTIVW